MVIGLLQAQNLPTITAIGANRATAYGMQNKIVSVFRNNVVYTYVAFVEETQYNQAVFANGQWRDSKKYAIYVREIENIGPLPGSIVSTTFIGYTWEPYLDDDKFPAVHGGPSLTIDKFGYLHIIYGYHYDKLEYAVSNKNLTDENATEPLSFNHCTISDTIKRIDVNTTDKWTYPIIKADDSNRLHIAGSLDSQYTHPNSVVDDNNDAKEIGYLRKYLSGDCGGWTYPQKNTNDPINTYDPLFQCRYDVMMNIDANNDIHILAPDQASFKTMSNYGYLDYHHFKSADGGGTFTESSSLAYENDGQLYENGLGNVTFDRSNNPHFLVYITDSFDSTNSVCNYNFKTIKHVYLKNGVWNSEFIPNSTPYTDVHLAKLRIDDDDNIFIVMQASGRWNGCSNSASPSVLLMATKRVDDPIFDTKVIYDGPDNLAWYPSIEEDERYTADKNWFYILAQEGPHGDTTQIVTIHKVIPWQTTVTNRIFSKQVEYFTVGELQTQGSVTINNGGRFLARTNDKIVLNQGFKVQKGAYMNAVVDQSLCNNAICLSAPESNSGGRLGIKKYDLHVTAIPEDLSIHVFPNPNRGQFWISNAPADSKVKVFNAMGQRIPATTFFEANISEIMVDISSAPRGVYIILLESPNARKTGRIVKE